MCRTASGSIGRSWSPWSTALIARRRPPARALVREGVDAQVAGLAVVGVDRVPLAPGADAVDDLVRLARELERGLRPEALGQVAEALPPAVDEAAVAPRRATAADVLLEQHDRAPGLARR